MISEFRTPARPDATSDPSAVAVVTLTLQFQHPAFLPGMLDFVQPQRSRYIYFGEWLKHASAPSWPCWQVPGSAA